MWPNLQKTANLVKFSAEILNGKLHFLCGVHTNILYNQAYFWIYLYKINVLRLNSIVIERAFVTDELLRKKKFWNTPMLVNSYLFKVNSRNTRKRCEIYSKLTIKISQRHRSRHSGFFTANNEYISHLFLVLVALTR